MDTALVLLFLVGAFVAAWQLWPCRLNPMALFVLAWAPGLLFTTVRYHFITDTYAVLNNGVGLITYCTVLYAFMAFSLGALVARDAFGPMYGSTGPITAVAMSDDRKLWQLFAIGLAVFIYAFAKSGLINQLNLSPEEVFERRLALHLGPVSHLVIFLDVTSTVFTAKYFETKRIRYLLPLVITLVCYAATLQKSRVLFIALSSTFITLLYPREAKKLIAGTFVRKLISITVVFFFTVLLLVMNAMRGIGSDRYTDFESTVTEQVFIYSGATAIINLAAAIEEHVTIDPPTNGLVLLRPLIWHFVDRESINPTKYFEGINASTFLIYPWADFRWMGIILVPFLTGFLVTLYFRMAWRRSILGFMLGAIGFYAVALSVNTDVVFDPTTLVILIVSVMAHGYAGTSQRGIPRHPVMSE